MLLTGFGCGGDLDGAPFTSRRFALYPDGDFKVSTGLSLQLTAGVGLTADALAGSSVVQVSTSPFMIRPKVGGLLMLYQPQGAQMTTSNDEGYGQITDFGGAGRWEITRVRASDEATGRIELEPSCGGLRNSYFVSNGTQVLPVPQFKSLTIEDGAVINSGPWSRASARGGILAMRAETVRLDGQIDSIATGFVGGGATPTASTVDETAFVSATPAVCGEKGESIVGPPAAYDALGGRYCRGAPANGGGGGHCYGAGGGGGAGGGSGALDDYDGHGVMDPASPYALSWKIDPYVVVHGALARSLGGGRGGYTWSTAMADPQRVPPGSAVWSGSDRRERGGRGGHPLLTDSSHRIFFGGGGGGATYNGAGTFDTASGASGGGLIVLLARHVSTSSPPGVRLRANGGNRQGGSLTEIAGGGGGGGGSVVFWAKSMDPGISVSAIGGYGGRPLIRRAPFTQALGPGGGGSGGFIAAPLDKVATNVTGFAVPTTTESTAMTAFPMNGATGGGNGTVVDVRSLAELPICLLADLEISLTASAESVRIDEPFELTAIVRNSGPEEIDDAVLTFALPAGVTLLEPPAGEGWSCSADGATHTCRSSELGIDATALPVRLRLSAREDAPRRLAFSVRASSSSIVDPVSDNDGATAVVAIESATFRGGGFGCSVIRPAATGCAATARTGLGLLVLAAGARILRRRRAQRSGSTTTQTDCVFCEPLSQRCQCCLRPR